MTTLILALALLADPHPPYRPGPGDFGRPLPLAPPINPESTTLELRQQLARLITGLDLVESQSGHVLAVQILETLPQMETALDH